MKQLQQLEELIRSIATGADAHEALNLIDEIKPYVIMQPMKDAPTDNSFITGVFDQCIPTTQPIQWMQFEDGSPDGEWIGEDGDTLHPIGWLKIPIE